MARQKDIGITENFFKRDGRLNRWRYFKRSMLLGFMTFILGIAVSIIAIVFLNINIPNDILVKFILVIMLIPYFCLTVRRLHDMDKDETFAYVYISLQLAYIIIGNFNQTEPSLLEKILSPFNLLLSLYILLGHGTDGDNKYGSDPLE